MKARGKGLEIRNTYYCFTNVTMIYDKVSYRGSFVSPETWYLLAHWLMDAIASLFIY